MENNIGQAALIRNPALEAFEILIGEWDKVGSHPYLPGQVLRGSTSFEWTDGGAFVKMHSQLDHKDMPSGVAIFGSDGDKGACYMLYFDERKVSRMYNVAFNGNVLKWWRDDEKIAQTNTCTISEDGNTIVAKGRLSQNGGEWENDLELTYTRVRK